MEKCCILACFPWVVQPCFLYNQRSCAQGVVSFIVGWAFHQSSVKKMPQQAYLHANMIEEFLFQIEVPSSQVILVCAYLTKTSQHNGFTLADSFYNCFCSSLQQRPILFDFVLGKSSKSCLYFTGHH